MAAVSLQPPPDGSQEAGGGAQQHPHARPLHGRKAQLAAALGLGAGAPGLLWALLAAVAGSQQDCPAPAPALEQGQQQQLGAGHLLKAARWGQNNNNNKKRKKKAGGELESKDGL